MTMDWATKVDWVYQRQPTILYTAFRPPFVDKEVVGVQLAFGKSALGLRVGSEVEQGKVTKIIRRPTRSEVEDALVQVK